MPDGKILDDPNEIFSSYFIEDFNNQFLMFPTKHITTVATDGIFPTMRDYVDNLTDDDFVTLLNWHYATCERLDHQGLSSHMLYICRKIK